MADYPQTSVVIAAYNRGPKIAATLDSVLRQSVKVSEIIVIDDGSTDNTGQWVREHYPMVRVEVTANGGTSVARNKGAAAAKGKVLIFLDHDDELMPNAVEILLDLLRQHPEAKAAFADHTYINLSDGRRLSNHHTEHPGFARLRKVPPEQRNGQRRLFGKPMYYALLEGNLLQQPWAIYRGTFRQLHGFATDIRYCEDWDMYLRLTARFPVAVTDEVISNHYVTGDNLHLTNKLGPLHQGHMHVKVLRRQWQAVRGRDPQASAILRRRLAMYDKTVGDYIAVGKAPPAHARAWYFGSFRHWPYDTSVAARTLRWRLLNRWRRASARLRDIWPSRKNVAADRRAARRMAHADWIDIRVERNELAFGFSYDLSALGVGFLSPASISTGECTLLIPDRNGKPQEKRAQVMYCRPVGEQLYQVGARFLARGA